MLCKGLFLLPAPPPSLEDFSLCFTRSLDPSGSHYVLWRCAESLFQLCHWDQNFREAFSLRRAADTSVPQAHNRQPIPGPQSPAVRDGADCYSHPPLSPCCEEGNKNIPAPCLPLVVCAGNEKAFARLALSGPRAREGAELLPFIFPLPEVQVVGPGLGRGSDRWPLSTLSKPWYLFQRKAGALQGHPLPYGWQWGRMKLVWRGVFAES